MSVSEPAVEIVMHACPESLTLNQMHFKEALQKLIKYLSAVVNVSVLDDDETAKACLKGLVKQILHPQHRIQHILKKRKEFQQHHSVNASFIDAKNVRPCH